MNRTFTPSDLQAIEALINSITVSVELATKSRAKADTDGASLWWQRQAEKTCELADRFGICVSGLQHCRRQMELDEDRRYKVA